MNKEERAIEIIKLGAQMSLQYYDKPIICRYSGGKDSEVLLDLFIKSGVEFEVWHSHTTVDAPETVYHVRKVFKSLEQKGINAKIIYPEKTMWELIVKNGIPPTRQFRYCCSILKENSGKKGGKVVATGVRKAEGSGRKDREEFETFASSKKNKKAAPYEIMLNNDNGDSRRIIERCVMKGEILVNPIVEWTNSDIWKYIRGNNIKYNPLYDMGYTRVGCIGCPMAGAKNMKAEFTRYPVYKKNYIKSFDKMIAKRLADGKSTEWSSGEEVMKWWINDDVLEGQIGIFENREGE